MQIHDSVVPASTESQQNAFRWVRLDHLFDADPVLSIDREVLRRSEMAASKLRHQYPLACEKLFADPSTWFTRFECLLQHLKEVVHGDQSSSQLVESLSNERPIRRGFPASVWSNGRLSNLLKAVCFGDYFRTHPSEAALADWLDLAVGPLADFHRNPSNKTTTSKIGSCQSHYEVLLLVQLRDVLQPTMPLLSICRLLSSEAIKQLHYPDANEFISSEFERIRNIFHAKLTGKGETVTQNLPPSKKTIPQLATQLLEKAGKLKGKDRSEIVCFLTQFGQPQAIKDLDQIGRAVNAEERRLRGVREESEHFAVVMNINSKKVAKRLLGETKANFVTKHQSKFVADVGKSLQFMLDNQVTPDLLREINAWLEVSINQFPNSIGLVMHLLEERQNFVLNNESRTSRVEKQLTIIFTSLCRQADSLETAGRIALLFQPLLTQNQYGRNNSVFALWLSYLHPYYARNIKKIGSVEDLERLSNLIGHLARTEQLPKRQNVIRSLPAAAIGCKNLNDATDLIGQLERMGLAAYIDLSELTHVAPFANHIAELAELLTVVTNNFDDEPLPRLRPLSESPLGRELVKHWIRTKDEYSAEYFGNMCSGLEQAGQTVALQPSQTASTDWIDHYPECLHENLRRLAPFIDDAENVAKTIFAQDFVDRSKRLNELHYLRQRLETTDLPPDLAPRLRERCERIEVLLQQQPSVSPSRLKRLNQKLHNRILREFQRWLENSLSHQFLQLLPPRIRSLDLQRLKEVGFHNVLVGVFGLQEPERSWGLELLRLHLDGDVFPEMDFAENRDFLAKLEKAGIDIAPWMDSARRQLSASTSGRPIEIGFGQDPMDYLMMGHHFQTCLSPNSFYFFSTIANAVDVNKRVVYGKDSNGKVIGRCLIALNRRGELLRFRSYAHEHREKFDLDVEDFVDQLAVDMGTSRGKSGDIVRLVASRWYDDGVVEGKGKKLQIAMDLALQELQKLSVETNTSESERSHVQELLDRCFQDQDVAQFLDRMPRRDSTANPLPYSDWILEMLLDSARRFQSIEGQIILAQMCFELERDHLVSRALEWLTVKQWMPRFRRSVCNVTQCFGFHDLGSPKFVGAILGHLDATSGLRLMRASRKRSIRSDLEEICSDRRGLLADLHQRLGRHQLAQDLRTPAKQH